jgi:hypothetical protein
MIVTLISPLIKIRSFCFLVSTSIGAPSMLRQSHEIARGSGGPIARSISKTIRSLRQQVSSTVDVLYQYVSNAHRGLIEQQYGKSDTPHDEISRTAIFVSDSLTQHVTA